MTKRRRPGRKRKRRPQNRDGQIFNESADDGFERPVLRPRAKRPQRLDQHIDEDHWGDEMMAEEPFRPVRNYNRRRLYPKYDVEEEDRVKFEEEETTNKYGESDSTDEPERRNGYKRRPYSKRKYKNNFDDSTTEKIEATTNSPSGFGQVDLKALLKQSGGISLSELLQQRNLSLADLLKGEQHAISALTNIPEPVSEPSDQFVMQNDEQYNRRPNSNRRLPSVKKIRKHQQEEQDQITHNFNSNANDNLLSSKGDMIEYTTERRIFVPSHPKYYTSVDYKPNMKDLSLSKTTESFLNTVEDFPTMSTATENSVTQHTYSIVSSSVTFSTSENPTVLKTKSKSRARHTLPPTLAKLKSLAAKTTMKTVANNDNTENYPKASKVPEVPVKAIKIDLTELFGMPKPVNNLPKPRQTFTTEGPLKISVNIEQFIEENNEDLAVKTTEIDVTESADKLQELTAKDEIMEILSDTATRQNLTRLLELRNMTLDELVEQRERGSSQRHLADIFHNKTKEPEPTEEMVVDQIVKSNENTYLSPPSLFETFPAFELRPDNNIQSTHYTRESREDQFTVLKENKLNSKSNEISGQLVPVWRQAYTNTKKNNKYFLQDDVIIKDEAKRIEDIDNQLVDTINGAFNVDVINHHKTYVDNLNNLEEESEFFRLPYGVRSAIIASAIIIAISLIVFLTIFIIFKWTQKQRVHSNYTNSFSSAKIKTPILETPYQRRIFSSIMNATLGRKKKIPTISCTEPQSLQEYLWDNDRKPFQ